MKDKNDKGNGPISTHDTVKFIDFIKLSQSDFLNMFVTHILISNKHFPLTIIKALLKVMMNKLLTYLQTQS